MLPRLLGLAVAAAAAIVDPPPPLPPRRPPPPPPPSPILVVETPTEGTEVPAPAPLSRKGSRNKAVRRRSGQWGDEDDDDDDDDDEGDGDGDRPRRVSRAPRRSSRFDDDDDDDAAGDRRARRVSRAPRRSSRFDNDDDNGRPRRMSRLAVRRRSSDVGLPTGPVELAFLGLPMRAAQPSDIPPGCEPLNRYPNVLPSPGTRVPLALVRDMETGQALLHSDYINANFVRGFAAMHG
jgi:hypothetical protein